MTEEDRARRRANKRYNERVKLLAAFLSNIGVATLVGAVVLPMANDPARRLDPAPVWLAATLALHILAQGVLTLLRSED